MLSQFSDMFMLWFYQFSGIPAIYCDLARNLEWLLDGEQTKKSYYGCAICISGEIRKKVAKPDLRYT